ncbi:MAG: tRNA (adenosine(37)-N6)-threonylcarbamoyltransferase complex dimerization subunit type 1 TsaB [Phycisphaerae bacterium]|jgi:tRNA threonylcarbamoyladenosine biosynthesis protein TsaB
MEQKPLILAVETSGRTGSVAISLGEQMLSEARFTGPMRHSTEIFPAIGELLERFNRKPKEIEHIYISIGPGSFTGLRIAAALAKTMHLANAAKIIAVDTLDVIAANADDYIRDEKVKGLTRIATILDAKRGQFFIATYQNRQGRWEKSTPDCLMTAQQFLEDFTGNSQPVWLLGEGLVYYKDKFKTDVTRFLNERYWNPRAEKVYTLGWQKALAGQFADPLTLQPLYLRRPDIKEKQDVK